MVSHSLVLGFLFMAHSRLQSKCCSLSLLPQVSAWCVWVLLALLSICNGSPTLISYRPVQATSISSGMFVVASGKSSNLMVFGTELTNRTIIKFTDDRTTCSPSTVNLLSGSEVQVSSNLSSSSDLIQIGFVNINLQVSSTKVFYFCVYGEGIDNPIHQGSDPWLALVVYRLILPLWIQIIFIVFLMVLSGLFSGLNLGLMSLDPTTLKIVLESGSKRQRIYAKIIYRVRKHGNYLLCTLLLGNVLVNSTLTILLDSVFSGGLYAIISSTFAIVIFGEIIPQAICSRHGLVVGAWTIPLTLFFMCVTFPLSFPLSLILNLVLGKEIGAVYNRDQLLQLLSVTQDHHGLEKDEVAVISGVLAYKTKEAQEVMTKFENIFCISIESVLDFKMMKEIYESGFSRIPVYEETKENIVHLLYVRDLAFVDPDDKTTLSSHVQFYQHDLLFFFENTSLDDILEGFQEGKCHLGIIQSIMYEPDKDPVYVAVGVITMEDILEEILQREIVDETDRFIDNRTFKPRQSNMVDLGEFMECSTPNSLSAQQRLAVYQFLSTEVEPFKKEYISGVVLKRLLSKQIIAQTLLHKNYSPDSTFYKVGSLTKFFFLILEGRMEVKIGSDGMIFECCSFSHFGAQALLYTLQPEPVSEYRPDFSAWPATDCLVVIITQQQYIATYKASNFEKAKKLSVVSKEKGGKEGRISAEPNDVFSDEWSKAESSDLLAVSKSDGTSGLASISKFLSKSLMHGDHSSHWVKTSKERKASDQIELLSVNNSSPFTSMINLQDLGQVQAQSGMQILPSEDLPDLEAGLDSRKRETRMFRTSSEINN